MTIYPIREQLDTFVTSVLHVLLERAIFTNCGLLLAEDLMDCLGILLRVSNRQQNFNTHELIRCVLDAIDLLNPARSSLGRNLGPGRDLRLSPFLRIIQLARS